MRKLKIGAAALLAVGLLSGTALASTFPSTNDTNRTNGWAHVNVVSVGFGEITLEFVSTRNFTSCFEYRTDGDTSQALATPNPNVNVSDHYPSVCVRNSTQQMTFEADEYIEVRLAFGAEGDERFDWTRFDVHTCKAGEWESHGFKNQGLCLQFANTGRDSR